VEELEVLVWFLPSLGGLKLACYNSLTEELEVPGMLAALLKRMTRMNFGG
jgi:hypothetical protein